MNPILCFYFQVHQPFRLNREFTFFEIGSQTPERYEDEDENRLIMKKIAKNCYLPMNALLLSLLKKSEGKFKISFSISGMALEQFSLYAPEVLTSFQELVATGQVEILAETYYHSLASIYSPQEFFEQVNLHREAIKKYFNVFPTTFRNTELIYNNNIASMAQHLGFDLILAEGTDKNLLGQSPNFLYRPEGCGRIKLLTKNFNFSDDIAFRFSNKNWSEYPLTSQKYLTWLENTSRMKKADVINLFMDYETFGEHQNITTGIFDFFEEFIFTVSKSGKWDFKTPAEVAKLLEVKGTLSTPETSSWADSERDLSAWTGNTMQQAATEFVYSLEKLAKNSHDPKLIHLWRKLLSSDHTYYLSTKGSSDGDVHHYFSPYASPHDAFIIYSNILNDFKITLENQ